MILAMFAVRLRGHYLAIASLGFAVITYQILLNWISLTQGPLGIYGIAPPPPIAIPGLPAISFRNPVALFYLVAGFTLFAYFILDQLARSPIGETLTAIREDEVSAASLGINTAACAECPRGAPLARESRSRGLRRRHQPVRGMILAGRYRSPASPVARPPRRPQRYPPA